ncbi:hypothetical protein L6R52_17155 [Myxococcota bacterium]|nr:hypothetical protein [Myxococcota bacterium]
MTLTPRPTGRALLALGLAFALARCFDAPAYDGRACSAEEPCPVELVCDADARCRTPCATDGDCDAERACAADGRCRLRCAGDGECEDAERCSAGLCAPAR